MLSVVDCIDDIISMTTLQCKYAICLRVRSCISGIMVSVPMLSVVDRIDDIISMTTAAM